MVYCFDCAESLLRVEEPHAPYGRQGDTLHCAHCGKPVVMPDEGDY